MLTEHRGQLKTIQVGQPYVEHRNLGLELTDYIQYIEWITTCLDGMSLLTQDSLGTFKRIKIVINNQDPSRFYYRIAIFLRDLRWFADRQQKPWQRNRKSRTATNTATASRYRSSMQAYETLDQGQTNTQSAFRPIYGNRTLLENIENTRQ